MALSASRLAADLKSRVDAVTDAYISETSNPANASAYRDAMWLAVATAIINEFSNNATISSISVTMTPNDGPGHVHSPAATDSATGKIS